MDENLFQLLFDNAGEGIIVTNDHDSVLFINHRARELLELGESTNIDIENLLPLKTAKVNDKGLKEIIWNDKNISLRVVESFLGDQPVKLYYLLDVTEQVKQEESLFFLRAIIDNINDGVEATDSNGKIIIFNKQEAKMDGRTPQQMLGQQCHEAYGFTPEESKYFQAMKKKQPSTHNIHYIPKDGKEVFLVSSFYPVIKDDKILGVFSINRNVTKMRQLLVKTVELQEKLSPKNTNNISNKETRFTAKDIIGESSVIKTTISQAIKVAQISSPVLICGETGTGKEMFAQSIHNAGLQGDQPFVAINCAAIPETLLESILFGTTKGAYTGAEATKGLFEQAGEGTLFLDEINSMPLTLQAKILRVLQERMVRRVGATTEIPVHCRIISSTNENPWECVEKGNLRRDLYYRLAGVSLYIPPLRERYDDVEVLAKFFLQKFARLYGRAQIKISAQLLKLLTEYSWPGNVRELEHVIHSSISMLDEEEELSIQHLPPNLPIRLNTSTYHYLEVSNTSHELAKILTEVERKTILNILQKYNWNISKSAKYLGIGRQNLQYRMRKLEIKKPVPMSG